jgi:hypothetical protein
VPDAVRLPEFPERHGADDPAALGLAFPLGCLLDARDPVCGPPEAVTITPLVRNDGRSARVVVGLTIYMMITGHIPYDHVDPRLQLLSSLLELKGLEAAGELSPLARDRVEAIDLDDARFLSPHPQARQQFTSCLWGFLRSLVGPAESRPTAARAYRTFCQLFRVQGGGDARRPRQGVFATGSVADRLAA